MTDRPKLEKGERYTEFVSGVNQKGEAFVQMAQSVDGKRTLLGQMTPHECRSLAQNALQCAEAADTDALIWGFFRHRMSLEPGQISAMIADFRDYRASMGGSTPSTLEHWNEVMDQIAREKSGKPFDPTKKQ